MTHYTLNLNDDKPRDLVHQLKVVANFLHLGDEESIQCAKYAVDHIIESLSGTGEEDE